jgi:hypothetical protein
MMNDERGIQHVLFRIPRSSIIIASWLALAWIGWARPA